MTKPSLTLNWKCHWSAAFGGGHDPVREVFKTQVKIGSHFSRKHRTALGEILGAAVNWEGVQCSSHLDVAGWGDLKFFSIPGASL